MISAKIKDFLNEVDILPKLTGRAFVYVDAGVAIGEREAAALAVKSSGSSLKILDLVWYKPASGKLQEVLDAAVYMVTNNDIKYVVVYPSNFGRLVVNELKTKLKENDFSGVRVAFAPEQNKKFDADNTYNTIETKIQKSNFAPTINRSPVVRAALVNSYNISSTSGINEAKANMVDSKVIRVISDNLKKTDKKGGPVIVTTGGGRLSVALYTDGPADRFQASFVSGNKWKIIDSRGVAKASKKVITDDEAVQLVKAIFAKA